MEGGALVHSAGAISLNLLPDVVDFDRAYELMFTVLLPQSATSIPSLAYH